LSEATLLGLEGKTALVVGGGQGIGRASVLALGAAGADVAIVDREAERADAVAKELAALGRRAEAIAADVTIERECEALVARASAALAPIQIVINIVGQASWASLLEVDEETWERDHQLNLKQHLYVSRAVARPMIERGEGGSIAVVASVSGISAAPNHGAYGIAKAGLMAMVRTLSEEWFEYGIRVNAVAPGAVLTPRIEAQWAAGEVNRPESEVFDRMAAPEDIAGAALFLVSSLANKVNGQTLIVDGGTTVRFPFAMT
jgi:NAD(P)-dependent dehydrogenase (short-subunit alcohol dehydrogenase family)